MLSIIHCKWIVTKTYKVIHNFQKLYRTNTFWTHIYIVQPSVNFPINSLWIFPSTKQFTILKLINQNSKKLYKSNTFWTHTYHDMMICLTKQTNFCLHLFEYLSFDSPIIPNPHNAWIRVPHVYKSRVHPWLGISPNIRRA